jgi:uncharacterized protein (TIGR02996 family)
MTKEEAFLDAIDTATTPDDANAARLQYSDWLDEEGRSYDAALQREAAGVSVLRYDVLPKSTPDSAALLHEGYRNLNAARGNITYMAKWGLPREDFRVVVVEERRYIVCTLPGDAEKKPDVKRTRHDDPSPVVHATSSPLGV